MKQERQQEELTVHVEPGMVEQQVCVFARVSVCVWCVRVCVSVSLLNRHASVHV